MSNYFNGYNAELGKILSTGNLGEGRATEGVFDQNEINPGEVLQVSSYGLSNQRTSVRVLSEVTRKSRRRTPGILPKEHLVIYTKKADYTVPLSGSTSTVDVADSELWFSLEKGTSTFSDHYCYCLRRTKYYENSEGSPDYEVVRTETPSTLSSIGTELVDVGFPMILGTVTAGGYPSVSVSVNGSVALGDTTIPYTPGYVSNSALTVMSAFFADGNIGETGSVLYGRAITTETIPRQAYKVDWVDVGFKDKYPITRMLVSFRDYIYINGSESNESYSTLIIFDDVPYVSDWEVNSLALQIYSPSLNLTKQLDFQGSPSIQWAPPILESYILYPPKLYDVPITLLKLAVEIPWTVRPGFSPEYGITQLLTEDGFGNIYSATDWVIVPGTLNVYSPSLGVTLNATFTSSSSTPLRVVYLLPSRVIPPEVINKANSYSLSLVTADSSPSYPISKFTVHFKDYTYSYGSPIDIPYFCTYAFNDVPFVEDWEVGSLPFQLYSPSLNVTKQLQFLGSPGSKGGTPYLETFSQRPYLTYDVPVSLLYIKISQPWLEEIDNGILPAVGYTHFLTANAMGTYSATDWVIGTPDINGTYNITSPSLGVSIPDVSFGIGSSYVPRLPAIPLEIISQQIVTPGGNYDFIFDYERIEWESSKGSSDSVNLVLQWQGEKAGKFPTANQNTLDEINVSGCNGARSITIEHCAASKLVGSVIVPIGMDEVYEAYRDLNPSYTGNASDLLRSSGGSGETITVPGSGSYLGLVGGSFIGVSGVRYSFRGWAGTSFYDYGGTGSFTDLLPLLRQYLYSNNPSVIISIVKLTPNSAPSLSCGVVPPPNTNSPQVITWECNQTYALTEGTGWSKTGNNTITSSSSGNTNAVYPCTPPTSGLTRVKLVSVLSETQSNYNSGLGGISAAVGYNSDLQGYDLPGSLVAGSFVDGGTKALVTNKRGSAQQGKYIFKVRNGLVVDEEVRTPLVFPSFNQCTNSRTITECVSGGSTISPPMKPVTDYFDLYLREGNSTPIKFRRIASDQVAEVFAVSPSTGTETYIALRMTITAIAPTDIYTWGVIEIYNANTGSLVLVAKPDSSQAVLDALTSVSNGAWNYLWTSSFKGIGHPNFGTSDDILATQGNFDPVSNTPLPLESRLGMYHRFSPGINSKNSQVDLSGFSTPLAALTSPQIPVFRTINNQTFGGSVSFPPLSTLEATGVSSILSWVFYL